MIRRRRIAAEGSTSTFPDDLVGNRLINVLRQAQGRGSCLSVGDESITSIDLRLAYVCTAVSTLSPLLLLCSIRNVIPGSSRWFIPRQFS